MKTLAIIAAVVVATALALVGSGVVGLGGGTSGSWATTVVAYQQGTLVGGGPITDPIRIDPQKALGAPDDNFFSLGFNGGYVIVSFGKFICNKDGADLKIVETTWGEASYPLEKAEVLVSQDGISFQSLGIYTRDSDICLPSSIPWVKYVKIKDATDPALFQGPSWANADGYDLDAVYAYHASDQPCGLITVPIDIKPGSFPNSINPNSNGKIPVAIFSIPGVFSAPDQVDRDSLTFGRTGNEASLSFVSPSPEDVDGDGWADLVAHFDTRSTGFQPGDTEGILKGRTISGQPIIGKDSVRIVPSASN